MNLTLSSGWARYFFIFLIVLAPAIMGTDLVYLTMGVGPSQFAGSFPNDMPAHWTEINAFRSHGFNAGYFTADEKPAQASFFHFSPHGPLYPAIVGSLSRLTGWRDSTPVYFNMAFVGFGLLVLILLSEPDGIQLALLLLTTLVCWPIHLLVPTVFQESFHHCGALILAALFYKWLKPDAKRSKALSISILILIVSLSLVRMTWAFFLVPFLWVEFRRRFPRYRALSVPLSLAGIAVLMEITGYIAAPGLNSVTDTIRLIRDDPMTGLVHTLLNSWDNFQLLLIREPIDCILKLQMLGLFFGIPLVYLVSRSLRPRKGGEFLKRCRTFFPEGWFHWFNVAVILVSSLGFYLEPGYFRIFSTTIVFTWYLMILTRRFGFVLVSILANLVAVTSITASTAQWKPNFLRYTPEYLESVRAEFAKVIHFDTSTKNPWCNTVLANWMSYDARYSQVPAGIGIGIIYPFRSPTWKIRSRYVLLDKREWDYFKNVPGLRMLTVLPGRNLAVFDNTEANCPALDIPAIAPLNSPGAASRVIPAATRKNR